MKAPETVLVAMLASGHTLATGGLLQAMPLGGAVDLAAIDPPPTVVMQVQGAERLDRLWQHRSILEQALQATPETLPEAPLPRARLLQAPAPQPELSASPQEPEAAPAEEQVAEASDDVLSCEDAAKIVGDYGFSEIQPTACSGEVYRFSATRDGTGYSIGIAAAAGEITEVGRE